MTRFMDYDVVLAIWGSRYSALMQYL